LKLQDEINDGGGLTLYEKKFDKWIEKSGSRSGSAIGE